MVYRCLLAGANTEVFSLYEKELQEIVVSESKVGPSLMSHGKSTWVQSEP